MTTLLCIKSPSPALVHLAFASAAVSLAYALYVTHKANKGKGFFSFKDCGKSDKPGPINHQIKKDEAKVVDTFEIEDLGNKTVLCRCWRSKCFPKCDGSHAKHNKETGDNVGPIIIQKRESSLN